MYSLTMTFYLFLVDNSNIFLHKISVFDIYITVVNKYGIKYLNFTFIFLEIF